MSQKDRQFEIDLSEYSPLEREAIALEVIDRIQKRTKQGLDKNGNKFAPYSKTYKESQNFEIAGKTARVNLELSGDMLDSMEIIRNQENGKVIIGYSSGNPEGGKAEGNILGTYGQSSPVGPKRDFLGISESELEKITAKYPPETSKSERRAADRLTKEGESERLSGRITMEDLDDLEDL